MGKTESIRHFARTHYDHVIEINFVFQPQYARIFDGGYEVDAIIKNITLINPRLQFVPGNTLLFFDEMQACPKCATCLKPFKIDGRYDVICSGSLMGINYAEIESVSVGYKEDFEMRSMDFEEFLWAKGYDDTLTTELLQHMLSLSPVPQLTHEVVMNAFRDYMVIGGMPEVVKGYIDSGNFSGSLALQRQLHRDYEEDVTKYAAGFDKGKILNVYHHIPVFMAKENKKFQVSKIARGARNREYLGAVEWLADAGIVNACYCMAMPELPLKGNYNPAAYKLYFADTGMLVASLDDEAQDDLRQNRNFGTCKGAIYENIVADMLAKQGYGLYHYKDDANSIETDFFVRDASSLIPVEVKAGDSSTPSLRRLIESPKFADVKYGIKLGNRNIGFNGEFYTFPYYLTFLMRRYLSQRQ